MSIDNGYTMAFGYRIRYDYHDNTLIIHEIIHFGENILGSFSPEAFNKIANFIHAQHMIEGAGDDFGDDCQYS